MPDGLIRSDSKYYVQTILEVLDIQYNKCSEYKERKIIKILENIYDLGFKIGKTEGYDNGYNKGYVEIEKLVEVEE